MAPKNTDDILDLTELIEKGPNIPDGSNLSATTQSTAASLNSSNDNQINDLLAQLDKNTIDPQEKLDMSGLDHMDHMLSSLPGRSKPKPQANNMEDEINNDLNDLLAAVDAEPKADGKEAQPKKKEPESPLDDLDALISQAQQQSQAQTETASLDQTLDADLNALLDDKSANDSTASDPKLTEDLDALLAEPKPAQGQKSDLDDLDALLTEPKEAQPTKKEPSLEDDLDALLADPITQEEPSSKNLSAPDKPQASPKDDDDFEALLNQAKATPTSQSPKTEPSLDEIDAILNEAPKAKEANANANARDDVRAINALEKRLSQCEVHLDSLENDLSSRILGCEEKIAHDLSNLNDLKAQPDVESLLAPGSILEEKILNLIQEQLANNQANQAQDPQVQVLNKQCADLAARLADLENAASPKEPASNLESRVANLETAQAQIMAEMIKIKDSLAQIETNLATPATNGLSRDILDQELDPVKALIQTQKADINGLKDTLATSLEKLVTKEELAAELEKSVNANNDANNAWAASADLETLAASLDALKSDLTQSKTELLDQITSIAQAANEQTVDLDPIKTNLDLLGENITQIQTQIEAIKTEFNAELAKTKDELAQDLTTANQKDDLLARLEPLEAALPTLSENVANIHAQLNSDLADLKNDLEQTKNVLNADQTPDILARLEPLEAALPTIRENVESLTTQLQIAKDELADQI
ncbi:MAG: hypothetical protein IJT59_00085, partial [Desulfovibrionaceae bacterium]|nr:hypothetical protein [Desulfovibrionaceae bacterium]